MCVCGELSCPRHAPSYPHSWYVRVCACNGDIESFVDSMSIIRTVYVYIHAYAFTYHLCTGRLGSMLMGMYVTVI